MLYIALLTVFVLHTNLALTAECEPPWVKVNSKCIWTSCGEVTWDENRRRCEKLGATLASPKTSEENEILKKHIGKEHVWYWLSGRLKEKGGTKFIWGDGEEINYSDWNPGQPNQMDSDRGACIQLSGITGWDDDHCDKKYLQMCEKEIGTQEAKDADKCDTEEFEEKIKKLSEENKQKDSNIEYLKSMLFNVSGKVENVIDNSPLKKLKFW